MAMTWTASRPQPVPVLACPRRPRAVVVGAGVSGLTTALLLRRAGFGVTVVASAFGRAPGAVAGALWEWRPALFGLTGAASARETGWAFASYRRFCELAGNQTTGVVLRRATYYLPTAGPASFRSRRSHSTSDLLSGLRHDAGLIEAHGIGPASGMSDAYAYLAPMIDITQYVAWLTAELLGAGVGLMQRVVRGDELAVLRAELDADIVVDCVGIGSPVVDAGPPLHGGSCLLINDGSEFPVIRQSHCAVVEPPSGGATAVFVVPRGDRLVVGGVAESQEQPAVPVLTSMLDRCHRLLPALAGARVRRPVEWPAATSTFRSGTVRVERDAGTIPMVHNHGHRGSGVTLSWGAAATVVELAVADVEQRRRSRPAISWA
jgi:D-amino-acid oxidase